MLIRQGVVDRLDQRDSREDLICHIIHGSLYTGAVLLCEGLEGDIPRGGPRLVELGNLRPDSRKVLEELPGPAGVDFRAEDPIPCLRKSGVLVADETPELRVGALQYQQARDGGFDLNALALGDVDLDVARFAAVAEEGVRVWLAVNGHAGPAVGDDVDVRSVDVGVFLDEVSAQDGSKELWRSDGILLGEDIDGVLDRVCGYDNAVVGRGVSTDGNVRWLQLRIDLRLVWNLRGINLSLEQYTHRHLNHRVYARLLVTVDFVDTNVIFPIAGRSKSGSHDDSSITVWRVRKGSIFYNNLRTGERKCQDAASS